MRGAGHHCIVCSIFMHIDQRPLMAMTLQKRWVVMNSSSSGSGSGRSRGRGRGGRRGRGCGRGRRRRGRVV